MPIAPPAAATEQRVTYCRICEPMCGLIATVSDNRLLSLRPDGDHPLSRGRACPKGIAFTDVQNDPDRVLEPLRRRSDGTFEKVSWDQALDDIAARLSRVIATHGGRSVGQYFGNPAAFGYATSLWSGVFMARIGSRHLYSAGSQDINSRFVASKLLYGAASQLPFPDLPRTHFLLMLGANPLVSHGSALRAPRIKDDLADIVRRGGRVVVIDPRRTETARLYEHVAVHPDSDAWLLLSMLHVIFAEGLQDDATIEAQAVGVAGLKAMCAPFRPEVTAQRTGVDADVIRNLARDFAAAPTASAYGRTGACLGRYGTLVSFLLDALTLVSGNLDRPGGTLMSHPVIPLEELGERLGSFSDDTMRSRIGDLPDVNGTFPAAVMADEITTPGPGQMRALFVVAGNPVLSVPNSSALESALAQLDLFVSFDLYVNETNMLADYILPGTTMLERDDLPIAFAACSPTLFVQSTEAVLEPYGQARPEWEVYAELARRMGLSMFATGPLERFNRLLAWLDRRWGVSMTPQAMMGLLLRLGPYGDRFGLRRRGLNLRKLRAAPHGLVLADHAPTGILGDVVRLPGGKVRLDPEEIRSEVGRLDEPKSSDPSYPLLLIGIREMRSQNSWMHNSPTLMKGGRRQRARINPVDAASSGIVDGEQVRIVSPQGAIETEALITDEIKAGTIAVPQGWGHRGGWALANSVPGANVNELTSDRASDLERLAGMSVLNGVRVRVEPAGSGDPSVRDQAVGHAAAQQIQD